MSEGPQIDWPSNAEEAAYYLETEIACDVHSADTIGGYLRYEYRGRRFRVDLTLTEEN